MWDSKINTSVISEFLKHYKTSFLVSVVFCRLFVPVWASLAPGLGNFLLQCYCWHSPCYLCGILCLCLWFGNLVFCGVPKSSRVLFICFCNFPLTFPKWSNSSNLSSNPDSVFKMAHSIGDVFYWGELAFFFSFMNTDAKLLNKILSNLIQEHINKDHPPWSTKLYSRNAGMAQYTKINTYNLLLNKLEEKTHCCLIRCRKVLWQNLASIHDKSTGEIRTTREIPLHYKGNLQQSCSQHQLKWNKTQSNSTKTRDRTRLSTLSTPIQYRTWSLW